MKGRPCNEPQCQEIGALIWIRVEGEGDKKKPLNPEPETLGNIRIVDDGTEPYGVRLRKTDLTTARANGEPLFRSHFKTCPGFQKYVGQREVRP